MSLRLNVEHSVQPVILAGGMGTRLRPRTDHLPKPLLPVNGRPVLWYTLQSLSGFELPQPIVAVEYFADLIEAYFSDRRIAFRKFSGVTMAEVILRVAEESAAPTFLGMSADVLLGPNAVREMLASYHAANGADTVLLVNLVSPGHKNWHFVVTDETLEDIEVVGSRTTFERLVLILRRNSLLAVRKSLGQPINADRLPIHLRQHQTGWILLLKATLELGITVRARIVDVPVFNINVPDDFLGAEKFVRDHLS